MKPIVMNGIDDVVNRPDLADRMIALTLEPISEEGRRTSKELSAALDIERPKILGALLTAVSMGLKMLPQSKLAKLPRMANFAQWIVACEHAIWPAGSFLAAYDAHCDRAIQDIIGVNPVAAAVRTRKLEWHGISTAFLTARCDEVGERITRSKGWPVSAKRLSGQLRRVIPALRRIGIEISFGRVGKARTPTVVIKATTLSFSEPAVGGSSASAALQSRLRRLRGHP